MFTYAYTQPEAYHFSLDSIHFAEYVAKQIEDRSDLANLRVLDLCAGCGVIGFELAWYVRQLRFINFVEIQEIYTPFFLKNVETVNRSELHIRWHNLNYEELTTARWQNQYDLIVSNPPYFFPEHGLLSPSDFKNRCRFFIDSTFGFFIAAMQNTLTPNGSAYFLLRSLPQHGLNMFSETEKIIDKSKVTVQKIHTLRGTDIILMQKN